MIEAIGAAVGDALRVRYGSGAVVERWGSTIEQTWSWQIPIQVGGSVHADLLLKIPRWPEVETLERAVAAGEQPSTVAEFEALISIGDAVAKSGDPELTMVEPVAFLPAVNGILMHRLEGRSLRRAVRFGSQNRDVDALFVRVGRLVTVVHGIGSPSRRPFDVAAVATQLSSDAVGATPDELRRLLHRLADSAAGFGRADEPVGNVHGDLNMGNVLVDRAGRVAVIDPNPAEGPQLADVALLGIDVRFGRLRLATAGWIGSSTQRDKWAAAFETASGAQDEIVWPFREALALGERWLRVESETSGARRAGLLPTRRLLGRELRRLVEELAG